MPLSQYFGTFVISEWLRNRKLNYSERSLSLLITCIQETASPTSHSLHPIYFNTVPFQLHTFFSSYFKQSFPFSLAERLAVSMYESAITGSKLITDKKNAVPLLWCSVNGRSTGLKIYLMLTVLFKRYLTSVNNE
jgi:hypothetical protein